MKIDADHPRAQSLRTREQLVWGIRQGITSEAGLIAHGRGEAFDYLLGEKTHQFARSAIQAAAAYLLLAKQPVLSVNGNVAAIASDTMIRLAVTAHAGIEVNLFHNTRARVGRIESHLKQRAEKIRPIDASMGRCILSHARARIITLPHIASARKITLHDGIAAADVVLVPLEDGDRCRALVSMGKTVIAIDLNPLSRTAQSAAVTIVDNITRAIPLLIVAIQRLRNTPKRDLPRIVRAYDNRRSLQQAVETIRSGSPDS